MPSVLRPCRCGGMKACKRCGAEPGHPVVSLSTLTYYVIGKSQKDFTFNGDDLEEAFESHGWGHLVDEVKVFYRRQREKERADKRAGRTADLLVDGILAKLKGEAKRGA